MSFLFEKSLEEFAENITYIDYTENPTCDNWDFFQDYPNLKTIFVSAEIDVNNKYSMDKFKSDVDLDYYLSDVAPRLLEQSFKCPNIKKLYLCGTYNNPKIPLSISATYVTKLTINNLRTDNDSMILVYNHFPNLVKIKLINLKSFENSGNLDLQPLFEEMIKSKNSMDLRNLKFDLISNLEIPIKLLERFTKLKKFHSRCKEQIDPSDLLATIVKTDLTNLKNLLSPAHIIQRLGIIENNFKNLCLLEITSVDQNIDFVCDIIKLNHPKLKTLKLVSAYNSKMNIKYNSYNVDNILKSLCHNNYLEHLKFDFNPQQLKYFCDLNHKTIQSIELEYIEPTLLGEIGEILAFNTFIKFFTVNAFISSANCDQVLEFLIKVLSNNQSLVGLVLPYTHYGPKSTSEEVDTIKKLLKSNPSLLVFDVNLKFENDPYLIKFQKN